MLSFVHLFPYQLGLNGERGNLDCLQERLRWAGIDSEIHQVTSEKELPKSIDAVFIGSGTLSGALEALDLMRPFESKLRGLASDGVPFFALGLGWEILGQKITLLDGSEVSGAGVYPSRSVRVDKRASCEAFGFDSVGNLTAGYANHAAEIELLDGAKSLIELTAGFGNSSLTNAPEVSGEGLIAGNLMAARLNGPLLPLNPHLADAFLNLVAKRKGIAYEQNSEEAKEVDRYALSARTALKQRLLS
jgi:CobQ-like glutamine amidotransferase family enzyme